MSKIRNSVLPDISPLRNEKSVQLFGDQVIDSNNSFEKPTMYLKDDGSDSDMESITLDLNKLSGLSSSSSLSWSDDHYETETSKKVYDELIKIDQVLRGEEDIPSYYDRDEFEEWMNLFPNLTYVLIVSIENFSIYIYFVINSQYFK